MGFAPSVNSGAVTERLAFRVRVSAPATPVITSVLVPPGVPSVVVTVSVELVPDGFGENSALAPLGMAVAAVDANDMRASFSSTGPEVTVAAPGVKILSTVPTGSCALCDNSGYRALSGTSMATPHTAGVAALLRSRGYTAAQAWEQLAGTTKDLGYRGWDTLTGWGRIDALAATTQAPSFLPVVDAAPPQVWFVSPSNGTLLSGNTVTVEVAAADDTGIQQIELWRSYTEQTATGWRTVSSRLATSTKSPLSYRWDIRSLPSRTYTLEARAIDSVGYQTIARITVVKP